MRSPCFLQVLAPLSLVVSLLVPPQARSAPSDEALRAAIGSPLRTPSLVARDPARHPLEELAFFGVTPGSSVMEIWPGGGYWLEILAPLLRDRGTYIAAMGTSDGGPAAAHFAVLPAALRTEMTQQPQRFGRVTFTTLADNHPPSIPAGSVDLVLTFRNLHNWMGSGDAPAMLADIRRVLKRDGILGIEDHRGNTRLAQDPTAKSGYVREDYAIALVEKAGFTLVGRSDIDANPKDTADWPKGVWTLPPVLAMGQTDRARYQAIGEADNFVLKFRKAGS